jgi:hypothetical protein
MRNNAIQTGETIYEPAQMRVDRGVEANPINFKSPFKPYMKNAECGIKGNTHIQYIPYESYYIDYEKKYFYENVVVPVQKNITDYYAVEHVVDYI